MSGLDNLSPLDFEDLSRDLATVDTGLRFEAFGPGPDDGIDGRHAKAGLKVILQCKHYSKSSFSDLKKTLRKEVVKIAALKPSRYILHTSYDFTKTQKDQILEIFKGLPLHPQDLLGKEDIEGLIRGNPEIEKAHIKLWLSSSAVLERILNSGMEGYTRAAKDDILEDLKVYVRNPSFEDAAERLRRNHVLIISGAPGAGKTTLARMLAYNYLKEDYRFYAISSLEDGFAKIDSEQKTLFFFDDFLGKIELHQQELVRRESALASFIRGVQRSSTARFILTSRSHILQEARSISDELDNSRVKLADYVLDVGVYTRRIRAYILFNHLAVSQLTQEHIDALLVGDTLKRIVDHRNFSPRIVASMSSHVVEKVLPEEYSSHVLAALDNPDLIWRRPYDLLPNRSKHLLLALFFGSDAGQRIDVLRENYDALHASLSRLYGQPCGLHDFEEALRRLESGFVAISAQNVNFVNPSLRDFLMSYFAQEQLLENLAQLARRSDWAIGLWSYVRKMFATQPDVVRRVAASFSVFAQRIDETPSLVRRQMRWGWMLINGDSAISERLSFLLSLWKSSNDPQFFIMATELARSGRVTIDGSRDASRFPSLIQFVREQGNRHVEGREILSEALEILFIEALEESLGAQELVSIFRAVEEHLGGDMSPSLDEALTEAVRQEFRDAQDNAGMLDSESDLDSYWSELEELSSLSGVYAGDAEYQIGRRRAELARPDSEEEHYVTSPRFRESEHFSDKEMLNLFSSLRKG